MSKVGGSSDPKARATSRNAGLEAILLDHAMAQDVAAARLPQEVRGDNRHPVRQPLYRRAPAASHRAASRSSSSSSLLCWSGTREDRAAGQADRRRDPRQGWSFLLPPKLLDSSASPLAPRTNLQPVRLRPSRCVRCCGGKPRRRNRRAPVWRWGSFRSASGLVDVDTSGDLLYGGGRSATMWARNTIGPLPQWGAP